MLGLNPERDHYLSTTFLAVSLFLLFLNRIPAGPPRIKTPTDMNLANSTSNINH